MQIYFHRQLFSHLSRVPILVEGTVYIYKILYKYCKASKCYRIKFIYIYIYKLDPLTLACFTIFAFFLFKK